MEVRTDGDLDGVAAVNRKSRQRGINKVNSSELDGGIKEG